MKKLILILVLALTTSLSYSQIEGAMPAPRGVKTPYIIPTKKTTVQLNALGLSATDKGTKAYDSTLDYWVEWNGTSWVQSGTPDLSAYQLKPSEGAFVNGDKTKLDGLVTFPGFTDLNTDYGVTLPFIAIDEGNGIGYRVNTIDTTMVGNIGENSFDFGTYSTVSTTHGSTGYGALVMGFENTGSEAYSFTNGWKNTNGSYSSFVNGTYITLGSGNYNGYKFATGLRNESTIGYGNSMLGTGHKNNSYGTTTVGQASLETTGSANGATTPMFVVGNGDFNYTLPTLNVTSRSDAFKVLHNGEVTAPSLTTSLIDSESTGKVLTTREWFEEQVLGSGTQNLQNVLDNGSYAESTDKSNYIEMSLDNDGLGLFEYTAIDTLNGKQGTIYVSKNEPYMFGSFGAINARARIIDGVLELEQQNGVNKTVMSYETPTQIANVVVPNKTGTVALIGDITDSQSLQNTLDGGNTADENITLTSATKDNSFKAENTGDNNSIEVTPRLIRKRRDGFTYDILYQPLTEDIHVYMPIPTIEGDTLALKGDLNQLQNEIDLNTAKVAVNLTPTQVPFSASMTNAYTQEQPNRFIIATGNGTYATTGTLFHGDSGMVDVYGAGTITFDNTVGADKVVTVSGTALQVHFKVDKDGNVVWYKDETSTNAEIHSAFQQKLYGSSFSYTHNPILPNNYVVLSGGIDITILGTQNGDTGFLDLIRTSGTEPITFATGVKEGYHSYDTTPGATIHLYFIHNNDRLQWFNTVELGTSGQITNSNIIDLSRANTFNSVVAPNTTKVFTASNLVVGGNNLTVIAKGGEDYPDITNGTEEFSEVFNPNNTYNMHSYYDGQTVKYYFRTKYAKEDAFIAEYEASVDNETIILRLEQGYQDLLIYWGDGTYDTYLGNNLSPITHQYSVAGIYDVEINGNFRGYYASNEETNNFINFIRQWGTAKLYSFRFHGMRQNITATDYPDVSRVTNLSNAFRETFMDYSTLDVSQWDVRNLTNTSNMWLAANVHDGNLRGFEQWQYSPENMSGMFQYCINCLNEDLSGWNISGLSNATDFNNRGLSWSTANYDATLIGWASQAPNILTGNSFHAGNATYTQGSVDSGTSDSTTAFKLVDSTQNFLATVTIGDIIHNTVNNTFSEVTAIDSDTTLSLENDIMVDTNTYVIQNSSAAKSRYVFTNDYSWTIIDGGGIN